MRARDRYKTAIIAGVGLAVASAPWWGLHLFLYVCGGILAVVGLVMLGAFLEFWIGFRAFEALTSKQAQRIEERRRGRIVGRIGQ